MTDPESISSGRSLPQWMKLRVDNKVDDASTTFSPPAHDDSFFYIRYPVANNTSNNSKQTTSSLRSLSAAINDLDTNGPKGQSVATATTTTSTNIAGAAGKTTNLTKLHTEPCKLFLDSSKEDSRIAPPPPAFANVKNQTKPFGTDDGFKGAGAACGSSIVKVARQMVSGKSLARGFTVANFNNDIEAHPDHFDEDQIDAAHVMSHPRYIGRRGSKSLPASPLGSPKLMRKAVQPNPYFTGGQFAAAAAAAVATQNTVAVTTAATTDSHRGWFLSSLLGTQREAISTTSIVSNISEETAEEAIEIPTRGDSTNPAKVLKAKPSELREMNFWSPTSM